ncbi:NucA/NucB deoxyribonuclease domain-containing protein [Cellulomonas soli]
MHRNYQGGCVRRKVRAAIIVSLSVLLAVPAASVASADSDLPPLLSPSEMPTGQYASADIGEQPVSAARRAASSTARALSQSDCVEEEGGDGIAIRVCNRELTPDTPQFDAAVVAETRAASTARAAASSVPADCANAPLDGKTFVGDRTNVCGSKLNQLIIEQRIDGVWVVTGQNTSRIYSYVYTSTDLRTWVHELYNVPIAVTGTAVGWWFYAQPDTSYCGAGCRSTGYDFEPSVFRLGYTHVGASCWQADVMTPGQVLPQLDGLWNWWYENPVTHLQASKSYAYPPSIRCDNALPARVPGCVIPGVQAGIKYNAAQLPDWSRHVILAQQSGLPSVLTRSQLESWNQANRATSCPDAAWLPRPAGYQCDEYPFASTREGASITGAAGARTFADCQVNLRYPASVGASGYSICMVPKEQNELAGSQINTYLINPQRVLDGDKYLVAFQ